MNYSTEETDIIVADSFSQLSYKQKKLFLASEKKSNPGRQKYADELIKTAGSGVYNKVRADFFSEKYRTKTLAELDKNGVECVTVKSRGYPMLLKQIPVPPLTLYAKGNLSLLGGELFAIVGSRKTTAAATEECRRISSELSERLTIVTGVANGADSAAAQGAVSSGNAICVLPGGHGSSCIGDIGVYREVEKCGLTISEFPPKTSARRYTFLLRNRIIAGMCRGVLVVSAAERSGALNTAGYAADYSREVFAFPYSLNVPSGAGCNNLIKNGAYLCCGAEDILSALGLKVVPKKAVEIEPEEKELLRILKDEGELHIEKLASLLGKKLFEVTATCSMLEIKGLIVRTGGNKVAAL